MMDFNAALQGVADIQGRAERIERLLERIDNHMHLIVLMGPIGQTWDLHEQMHEDEADEEAEGGSAST